MNEPIFKEKKEEFSFLKNEKKEGKVNIALIVTIIVSVIVLLFVGRSVYAFYIGFKYYDLRFEDRETEDNSATTDVEEVSVNSVIVSDTYKKINVTNVNELSNLFEVIYSGSEVNVTELTDTEKLAIVFSNLGIDCDNTTQSVTIDEVSSMAGTIFNDVEFIILLDSDINLTVENYNVSYDELSDTYLVSTNECSTTNDFLKKGISISEVSGDELYIYEYFGYFVSIGENTYEGYSNALRTELFTTYTDSTNSLDFADTGILKLYKWTYKKGSGNNYYFYSITPE